MRKRLLSFLLIFVLMLTSAVMLAGCSGSDEKDNAKTETSEEVKYNSKDESSSDASETSEGTEENQSESESVSYSGSSDDSTAKSGSKATKSKASKSKNKNNSSSSNKNGTSSGSTGGSVSSGDNGSEAKESYVTLSVDGAFAGKRIELSSGDSVYDVLKKSGVNIGAENSSMGVYVYSINGLKEGDKGPRSGWTYKVNGTMPPKSANAYFPKTGDSIRWEFVS